MIPSLVSKKTRKKRKKNARNEREKKVIVVKQKKLKIPVEFSISFASLQSLFFPRMTNLYMGRQLVMYRSIFQLVRCLVSQEQLIPLTDTLSSQTTSIYDLMSNLNSMAEVIVKRMQKVKEKSEKKEEKKEPEKKEEKKKKESKKEKKKEEEEAKKEGEKDALYPELEGVDLTARRVEQAQVSEEDQLSLATEIMKTHNLLKKYVDRYPEE